MNRDEFAEWLDVLGKRYPAALTFIEQNNAAKAWATALEDVKLELATKVIRKAFGGDLTPPVAYAGDYSQWPAWVRQSAFSLRWEGLREETSWRDRRDEVSCPDCFDEGYLSVVDPRQDAGVLRNPPEGWRPLVSTCVVACHCRAGQLRSNPERSKPLLAYNEAVMCKIHRDDTMVDRYEKLKQFWAECDKIENHPNYNAEFADWGATDATCDSL